MSLDAVMWDLTDKCNVRGSFKEACSCAVGGKFPNDMVTHNSYEQPDGSAARIADGEIND